MYEHHSTAHFHYFQEKAIPTSKKVTGNTRQEGVPKAFEVFNPLSARPLCMLCVTPFSLKNLISTCRHSSGKLEVSRKTSYKSQVPIKVVSSVLGV